MRLTEMKPGDSGIIDRVFVDGPSTLRIMTLGLVLGAKVTVLSKAGSNIELVVEGSRVAISGDLAHNIIVV